MASLFRPALLSFPLKSRGYWDLSSERWQWKALLYFPPHLSSWETEVGCYYYFMPQKSPAFTLRAGHSGGASCSGNALRGALSAHTIVHFRSCAIFLHAPWAEESRCYFSLVSHGKTRKAFSAPEEVKGEKDGNGQANYKIVFPFRALAPHDNDY